MTGGAGARRRTGRVAMLCAVVSALAALPWPASGPMGAAALVAQEGAGADTVEAMKRAATADTTTLAPLHARVRRTLFDPGLARSVERLDAEEGMLLFTDLADWLDARTGTGVRSRGGGGRQLLSIRGGRPEGVLVLLDGLPINDPLTGEADLASVSLASLSSATLVRGSGSARYGNGALGGALLLESSSAGRGEPSGRMGVGSFGAYELSASGGVDGELSARIGAGVRGAENDYGYENRLVHGSPERVRRNADSQARWVNLAAEGEGIRGTLRHDRIERGVPGRLGTTVFQGDRWRESRWSVALATGGERASGRLGLRHLSMEYARGATSGRAPSSTAQRALDLRVGGELALPRFQDIVVAGRASLERLRGDGIADADRMAAGATVRRTFRVEGAGVGFEPLFAYDVSEDGSALSPELGAWYQPDPATRLYGRLGRGYRLPTFADLNFEAAPGVRPNADLEPERVVLDVELGLELSRRVGGTEASLRLAAWRRDTRDPIVWLASSVAVWSPRNLDRLVARGLEMEASVGDRPSGSGGVGWRVDAGLTLQESRVGFGSNRNPLPYQPDVTASAGGELRRGSWAARLDATYTGSRTTSIAATRRLEGFLRIDMGLRRRLVAGPLDLVANLDVDNVLDRGYELVELFPEPGRAFRLTLEVQPLGARARE